MLIGIPSGLLFKRSAVNGKFYLPALCFRQSMNFYELLASLDSTDDLERLSGYYLYRDTGVLDLDYLYKRYRYDESDIIRKTIIWIASGESDKKKLQDFYGKIFEISPQDLQSVITGRVEILGEDVYNDFISRYKLKAERSN